MNKTQTFQSSEKKPEKKKLSKNSIATIVVSSIFGGIILIAIFYNVFNNDIKECIDNYKQKKILKDPKIFKFKFCVKDKSKFTQEENFYYYYNQDKPELFLKESCKDPYWNNPNATIELEVPQPTGICKAKDQELYPELKTNANETWQTFENYFKTNVKNFSSENTEILKNLKTWYDKEVIGINWRKKYDAENKMTKHSQEQAKNKAGNYLQNI